MRKMILAGATLAAAFTGSAGAFAQDRGDWGNGPPGGPGGGPGIELAGPGVPYLVPELRETPRGRAFVMRNFDFNHDGIIDIREARAADHAFMASAGPDRGRFYGDWHDRGLPPPPPPPPPPPMPNGPGWGGWDRHAMHDYGFHQTPRGASFNLSGDVLFATDSAVLRPEALDKLRPLVEYLRNQRDVGVAIDGYTDSRGGEAHNQVLSENRARSVRDALAGVGVQARFQITGHGASNPIASNATPDGMRQNRRVEVTLLGQQAQNF